MAEIKSYGALKKENIDFQEKISFLQKIIRDQFSIQTIDQEKKEMFEKLQNWTVKLGLSNLQISYMTYKYLCHNYSRIAHVPQDIP